MSAQVSSLVSEETLKAIGARDLIERTEDRAQWRISRPRFVSEPGICMLVITRQSGEACRVAIGRQGMCADIYTEAVERGLKPADVDVAVVRLCLSRYGREAVTA